MLWSATTGQAEHEVICGAEPRPGQQQLQGGSGDGQQGDVHPGPHLGTAETGWQEAKQCYYTTLNQLILLLHPPPSVVWFGCLETEGAGAGAVLHPAHLPKIYI